MAQTIALTEKQIEAAAYLAAGMSQGETASKVGVARQTVARWNASGDFKAEVERRKGQAIATHQETADRLQRQEIESFYDSLQEYKQAIADISKSKIQIGKYALQKAARRLKDLPDEAIAAKDISQLLRIAAELTSEGLEEWSEMLGVSTIMERLDGEDQQEAST